MRAACVVVAAGMAARALGRRRILALLLVLLPSVFLTVTVLTTRTDPTLFKLAGVAGEPLVEVRQRSEALVFVSLACTGLIAAFLGLTLAQRDDAAHRRLVLCGLRVGELLAARLAVLAAVVVLVGAYGAAAARLLLVPVSWPLTFCGHVSLGLVYGSYGLLVGALVRRELEGVLLVALLVNVDIGWLQNPLFYAEAQNRAIIRALPAFHPAQATMMAAFTDHSPLRSLLLGAAYGAALAAVALLLSWRATRLWGPRSPAAAQE